MSMMKWVIFDDDTDTFQHNIPSNRFHYLIIKDTLYEKGIDEKAMIGHNEVYRCKGNTIDN